MAANSAKAKQPQRVSKPTPIQTELRFDIVRSEVDRAVTSTARLLLGEEVLCTGEINAMALRPERLAGFRFGKRRVDSS